jgi:hypothetical protein
MSNQFPALERMKEVQPESQAIGGFIEWLYENGMVICERVSSVDCPYAPVICSIENLLARYFDIDMKAVERERQVILEEAAMYAGGMSDAKP